MASRWLALAVIFLTRTSMGVQFQSVASVAPLMVEDLRLSWAQVGSLIGLYMLPGAVLSAPGGLLGQRFGDRRVVIAGLSLMLAGGLVTAASGGEPRRVSRRPGYVSMASSASAAWRL